MRPLFRSMALLALLTVSIQVHADDKAIQKMLAANYAKFDQAFQKNNITVFADMMSSDYMATQPNGQKMGRAEMVANFKRERATMQQAEMQSKIESLSIKDNKIVATVQGRLVGMMSDPQEQQHKVQVIATSKDTWIKKNGVWKIKWYQLLTQTITVDGKPLEGKKVGK